MVVFDDTLPLDFGTDDPRFDQVEITCRSVDIDSWMEAATLTKGGFLFKADRAADLDRMIEIIAGSLVSWNLDDPDTGEPVPLDYGGLRSRPTVMLRYIVDAWVTAQASTSPPFAMPSNDGAPTAEIPMQSLAS